MASRRIPGRAAARRGLVLLRCAAPRSAPPLRPPLQPRGRSSSCLSMASGGERLARLLDRPAALPSGGYRGIASRGLFAVRSVPTTPSLTAVAHITHVTGALPQDTGIVSNWLKHPSEPFGSVLSGFRAPIRAETLWQAARRQGKRTGVMLYPGADGKSRDRSADFGMAWPDDPIAEPKLHLIEPTSWEPLAAAPAGTFSPARRVTLRFTADGSLRGPHRARRDATGGSTMTGCRPRSRRASARCAPATGSRRRSRQTRAAPERGASS